MTSMTFLFLKSRSKGKMNITVLLIYDFTDYNINYYE